MLVILNIEYWILCVLSFCLFLVVSWPLTVGRVGFMIDIICLRLSVGSDGNGLMAFAIMLVLVLVLVQVHVRYHTEPYIEHLTSGFWIKSKLAKN
jgi:hypothetical protein